MNISLLVFLLQPALLKESTALIVLLSWQQVFSRMERRSSLERQVVLVGSKCWDLGALGSRIDLVSIKCRWSIMVFACSTVVFTAWQLVFFASVPGCFLLLASLLKGHRWLYPGICLVLLFLPSLWINHYEAMYFAPFWLGAVLCIGLYGSLFWLAFAPSIRKHAGVAIRIFAKAHCYWLC